MSDRGTVTETTVLEDENDSATRQRYRTLTELLDDGLYRLDATGRFVAVNDVLIERLGYTRDDLLGEHVTTIFEDADRDRVRDALADCRMGNRDGTTTLEAVVRAADGRRLTCEFRLQPIAVDGEGRGVLGLARDITAQTERERELAESERRYRTLAESFPNGVVTLFDRDLEYTLAAGQGFADLDADPADVEGQHFRDVVPEETADALEPAFRAALEGAERTVELEFNGRIWSVRTVPVTDGGDVSAGMAVAREITERKNRERELAKYETIVETINDGIYVKDEDGRFTMVNDAYASLTGYSRAELVGEHASLVVDEATLTQSEARREAMAAGDATTPTMEAMIQRADGEQVPTEGTFATLRTGAETKQIGVVRDITERKRMERDLRESEARFRLLADNLEDVVWLSTTETKEILYINPAYEELWGRDSAALDDDPRAFADGIHPDDRERVMAAYADLPDDEFDEEFRIVTPDGEHRWIHARAAAVHDEDRDVSRIVGIAEDVSERTERERALEQSERRYRTLAENFPNGAVGVYDTNLRYTLTRGAVLGDRLPNADRLEGSRVSDIFPEELVADLEGVLRAAVEDGETGSITIEFDGRNWRVWAAPLQDCDGEVFAGLSFTQDVTEQVERERRLEELVAKLEESNKRLEQFAYAASHDLQEPLRMVSSYLQLIDGRYADALDDEAEEFLAYAVDGAERMRDMIDALLEYSRIETRGDPLEPVDLEAVFESVLDDLRLQIEDADATVTADELPRVEGDADQLRQVLQNLLSNAITYSGDEPPDVSVSAERDGDEWVVSVHDEGIGIAAEEQDRIFEVFQRLHSCEEYAGTGIGLALCQRIVERHGGDIWVDSTAGEGATFSFSLPAVESAQ
ncbi:PAS domain S-box protein [Natrinema versiforme]|uniref:histidine kinase n=1 Tax=Natrinema versiforme JCM 10478 TaxID=1227496 RepID=L9XQ97_9EURY|nr:PAS domain S-box protein [Natrinema versiforme]ELY63945.1 PAS/PAC sensor signal transduction histidine kinase [Natrinema versiforme JCM 10478]